MPKYTVQILRLQEARKVKEERGPKELWSPVWRRWQWH